MSKSCPLFIFQIFMKCFCSWDDKGKILSDNPGCETLNLHGLIQGVSSWNFSQYNNRAPSLQEVIFYTSNTVHSLYCTGSLGR